MLINVFICFLIIQITPRTNRTVPLFPNATRFRSLRNNQIYDLTGNAENKGLFILSNPVDTEIPMGESLSTMLKLPLWGSGDEKIGFVSTMDLPTIDECMRYEALNMLEDRKSTRLNSSH